MNKPFPIIRSVGPPPELHADRIVAEMLRVIVKASAQRMTLMGRTLAESADGNPKAQAKLLKKLEDIAGPFLLGSFLQPGKRGRYVLHLFAIDGWDAGRTDYIRDAMPDKPWLACTHFTFISKGHGRDNFETRSAVSLLVTHHSLSRLAQRCGAKKPNDLIVAVNNIWAAHFDEVIDAADRQLPIRLGRLKFTLREGRYAFAVMKPHEGGGIVVTTILDT